jgi:hypothetical protein
LSNAFIGRKVPNKTNTPGCFGDKKRNVGEALHIVPAKGQVDVNRMTTGECKLFIKI